MFEIGIISIIVLAVGYWVTLWLMGRRDDVLHGDFVHAEPATDAAAGPSILKASIVEPAAVRPAPAEPLHTARPASPTPSLPERSDTLQALLAAIKQDLKDASQL
jgi:hypothetical protein